jgi:hypothetical protein
MFSVRLDSVVILLSIALEQQKQAIHWPGRTLRSGGPNPK